MQDADTKGLAKTLRFAYAMAEAKYVGASPAPSTGGYSPMDGQLVPGLRTPSSRDRGMLDPTAAERSAMGRASHIQGGTGRSATGAIEP